MADCQLSLNERAVIIIDGTSVHFDSIINRKNTVCRAIPQARRMNDNFVRERALKMYLIMMHGDSVIFLYRFRSV